MNTHTENHEYHDALLDRGLAELLGNETPPDLSERILAAANTLPSLTITLAQSNPIDQEQHKWKSLAILCASLAIIGTTVGLLLPPVQVARQGSRSSNLALIERSTPRQSKPVENHIKSLPASGKLTGMGLNGLINDANAAKSSDEVMMAATPHIIIQEGEEERLGVATNEQIEAQVNAELRRRAASAPPEVTARRKRKQDLAHSSEQLRVPGQRFYSEVRPSIQAGDNFSSNRKSEEAGDKVRGLTRRLVPQSAMGLQGLINDAYTDQSVPYFQNRFGLSNGPEPSRDQYTPIHENPFITATGPDAVCTFSIDVDTASYANVRQFLESGRLPPPDAVRIEELVNYFAYDYAGPTDDTPFAAHMEIAACPWNNEHRLARIAIKGKEIDRTKRPQSNLVFLVDVSGSMNDPNKLPLLVEGMKLLTRELGENDKVAIVVYASSEGLALDSTRGNEQETILAALDQLRAGGSTAGGAGINRAYQVATDNFITGGTNRVILCTDGDFNVGVTDTDALTRLAEEKAKTGVFLTVLGFGRGNLNDAMMEAISGKGNGNYHYVDNLTEARKVLVEEMTGTLITIAKDVKIQVEFNPAQVAGYRLIGYENRMLKTEDFNNDKKDAGEIGAGHTVTALYEIVPAGKEVAPPNVDPLKYQQPLAGLASDKKQTAKPQAASNELLTLKLRYKLPDADKSTKLEFPITDRGGSFAEATKDFQFAAAVASFGMLLRHSEHKGDTSFDAVQEIAQSALSEDPHNYRAEFLELVRRAKQLQPCSNASHGTHDHKVRVQHESNK